MIRQSIPEGIDPPSSQLPRRLDKPVYSASSKLYADALKQQFSLASTMTTATVANNRPPRKQQAAINDYDSDNSTEAATATRSDNNTRSNHSTATINSDSNSSIGELAAIKQELAALRTMITTAVDQFKSAIATLATPSKPTSQSSSAMDTDDDDTKMKRHHKTNEKTELSDAIQDLKYELATIITETRAMFEQQLFRASTMKHPSSVT